MFNVEAVGAQVLQEEITSLPVGKEIMPIVQYFPDKRLTEIMALNTDKVWVGSVAGAGHMPPYGITREIIDSIGIARNEFGVIETMGAEQINQLAEALTPQPIRLLDTLENIKILTDTLYNHFKDIYDQARVEGAEKVLYSVCSVSPGYDICNIRALLRLMDEVGPESIIFSGFLPFSETAVRSYSFASTNGLNAEAYWIPAWDSLLQKRDDPKYRDSIFLHQPHLIPYDNSDDPTAIPDEKMVHARGKLLTNNSNTVYSNVNLAMVLQALEAVTDSEGRVHVNRILGFFGETFQSGAKDYIGGAPEVIMMLMHCEVPLENIHQVKEGLHNPQQMTEESLTTMYKTIFNAKLHVLDSMLPKFGEEPLQRTNRVGVNDTK